MAFAYRKRDPGSGGVRPGAGRRPDISISLRKEVGAHCAELYDEECAHYHNKQQLDSLIEAWDSLNPTYDHRHQVFAEVASGYELEIDERRFAYTFAMSPFDLYDMDGRPTYSPSEMAGVRLALTEVIYGYKIELPKFGNLPRSEIARIKARVVTKAKDLFALHGLRDVSDGFVKACWNRYGF